MLITNLVGEAYRMRRYPSEVYAHFLENPADLQLLWAYGIWSEERAKRQARNRKKGMSNG